MQRALYALVALFVLIVGAGFALPRYARVEIEAVVDAPPSVVFAQANDLRRLALWAAPDQGDADARLSYSSPARGEGASVSWNGPVSGSGSQRIVESVPYEYVSYLLNPGEPGQAAAWIELEPTAGGTRVVRGFEHDYGYNLVGRYFGMLWAGMIRRDYTLSLGKLRELVEKLPRIDYADLDISESFVEAEDIAYVVTSAAASTDTTSRLLGDAYLSVLTFMEERGLEASGPPLAILRAAVGARRRLDAAIPLAALAADTTADRGVRLGRTYEGHVVTAVHRGSYEGLAATHRKLTSYLAATGLEPNGDPWEVYIADPGRTPEAQLRTEVVYPVRVY